MKNRLLIIIAAVSLCIPGIIFGQTPPPLGTVSQFVIFSSAGAITHTGTGINSHITGDVGTETTGGYSGFGNVDGTMRAGDGVTATAVADLNVMYLNLSTQAPLTAHVPLLGGETLPPGLYEIPVPATPSLNGVLTLDGGGDPDAYFFFKLGTDFSTGPASEVKLINGAKACNVFWLVEGKVDIAVGTQMRGNIIVNNAAINIATGVTLEGRALSTTGAISVNTGLIATKPIGCGSPLLTGPLAPDLASTSCYAIFSSDGPVTDDGASFLTGDVGTNVGSTIGYDPLNVTGAIHPIPDISTNAAAVDVGPAYDYLNLLPNDIELLYPADFGYGLVLTPHTYIMNAAVTSFVDTVFLNAEGDSDAVFVIKVNGAFSTGTYSTVVLQNGAQAKNVFWQIKGAVIINDYSVFKGTIVSASAITLNKGVKIEGRVLTSVGTINTSASQVNVPAGTCGSLCIPASITTGPTNQTACLGDSIGFTVTATGDNLTYKWRIGNVDLIDDSRISGATTDTLSIDPAGPSDEASDYNVVIGGTCGNDTSIFVSFSISSPTDITLEPTDQTVCEGDSVGFTVTATGDNLTYQWRKGNVDLIDGPGISGATTDTLSIDPAGASDEALDYNVVVSGACKNDTSVNVSLTVNPTTDITLEPIDQMACSGDSIGFTVTATGDNLNYKWRKGDIDLIDGPGISGATTDTLSIDPTSASDEALDYNVVIGGTCGNDTSIFVSFSISSPTDITLEPIDQMACSGDSIGFTVTATGDNLTYKWRKGNVDLIDDSRISGATTDTLSIDPTSASDEALDYNVVIGGTCGNDTSIFVSFSISSPTDITLEPIDQIVCSGDSVGFTVTATGDNLTYQWRKGNVDLIDGPGISGATTDTLSIDPAGASDEALDYNVVVSGACKNDTSVNVSLTLNPTTDITLEPTDQTVCIGDSAGFTVTATGGLTYQWRKGNVDLIDGSGISGATTDTLSINPVSALDTAYNYNVIVTGTCGNDTSINVSLMVDSAAVIVVQPIDKTVCDGDSVYFSVVATGPNLTYQWRIGTVDLVDGVNISGATSDTLIINPATIADVTTDYNVVVTGGCSQIGSSSVNLNSAGDFGILSGVGISSTGFSVITNMDIGISPGTRSQISGFPPAIVVNGAIYASDDTAPPGVAAMLTQAKLDLKNAYLFAEGATMPAPATVSGDQGGVTLPPGIYKSTSTLLIQMGDLTLDAQGDPNASWIFQIASGFTTIGGAGGNVILAGGAQAKNVTWQVGSSAIIGNGTSFKGDILALESITMNTGSTIDGRLLARNGAVVLSGANLINQPLTGTNITSVDVSLTISPETVITSEPTDQTVCEGDSTGFTVTATGDNLTYQWRKGNVDILDGGNISGATTATLSIDPTDTLNTALDYNVIVSGGCKSDTSINVSLIVTPATVITLEPTNQMSCLGDSIGFTVTATGDNLNYKWRKGNVDLIDGPGISGVATDTLSIDPAGLSDEASDYNVVIGGTCGNDTSIFVSFSISSPTDITLEPIDQIVCSGDSVGFTVTATGDNLTYQWRKGNVDLIDGPGISGATTDTLSIDPAGASDEASDYNVVVSGACKSDTSINVSLIVNPATVITLEPTDQTVCEGDSIGFSVTATGDGLTYQWRKGNVDLIDGPGISGATTDTLSIDPTDASDEALDYNVVVSGTCGNDTSIFVSLILTPATVITLEPIDQMACLGDSIGFTVTATGDNLTYKWRKGDVDLTDGSGISGATTDTLSIDPAGPSDEASDYNVVIGGTCGNDTSIFVSFSISSPTDITLEPIDQIVCSGDSVGFTVTATGGNLTYQWRKGNVDLVDGGTISGATTDTLSINPAGASDEALDYNVVVSGACKNDTSINVSLTVKPTPVAIATSNSPVCVGEAINLTATTVTGGSYAWTSTTGYTSSTQNPSILTSTIADAGTYSLIVTADGCASIPSSTTVVVNECGTDLSVVKTVNNTQPSVGKTVVFTIVVTNNSTNDATGVGVNDLLQSGYTYVSSTVTTGTFNPTTGVWTIGSLANGSSETMTITVTVNATGNYVNTATVYGNEADGNMANNSSTTETFPTDFFIPEGFSPNGDGINDLFVIRGISNYPKNEFTIYNRWGNKVYEASSYQSTWSGNCTTGLTVGGDELPTGTYFYTLDLKDGSDVFKGTIYLNR